MRTTLRLALAVPAALLLVACSDGDQPADTGEGKRYASSMADTMVEDSTAQFPLSRTQADCWSTKFVNTVGLEHLRKIGTPDELAGASNTFQHLGLTRDQAGEIYDNFESCGVDLHSLMLKQMTEGLPESTHDCMGEVLTDDVVRDLIVENFVEGEDAQQGESPFSDDVTRDLVDCSARASDTPTS